VSKLTLTQVQTFLRDCDAESRSLALRTIIDRELEVARAAYPSADEKRQGWLQHHGQVVKDRAQALLLTLGDLARAARGGA